MCKPNMVYTVPPNVGCPRRGCPVIPGLGAHKGRPYGYVQNDNSDQAMCNPYMVYTINRKHGLHG